MVVKVLNWFAFGIACTLVIVYFTAFFDVCLTFSLWLFFQLLFALRIIEAKMPFLMFFAIFFLPILFFTIYNLCKTDRMIKNADAEIYEASKNKE